ncbi:MAG: GTP cyclohydrolase II RibA [Patescibacteria group bacterium]
MSEKVSIVTQGRIPASLADALEHHRYVVDSVPTIEALDLSGSKTIIIDTSSDHPDLKRCQVGAIPSNKTSFFTNLSRFESVNARKHVVNFLAKIGGDLSINNRAYNFFGETKLETEYGKFILFGFESRTGGNNVLGLRTMEMPLIPVIRTHSMCYTGDIFHSLKCDCREELQNALKMINEQGGMLIYPEEEGRGIGILNKIKIYQFQDEGADTVDAQHLGYFPNDLRTYDYLKDVFFRYRLTVIRLITNNSDKAMACYDAGVSVSEIVKLPSTVTDQNRSYLETKMRKSGHNFKPEFGKESGD